MQPSAFDQLFRLDGFLSLLVVMIVISAFGYTKLGTRHGSLLELISLTPTEWPWWIRLMRDMGKYLGWWGMTEVCLGHIAGSLPLIFGVFMLWLSGDFYVTHMKEREKRGAAGFNLSEAQRAFEKIQPQLPPFGEDHNSVALNVDTLEFVIGRTLKQTEDLAAAKWPDEMHRIYVRSL